MKLKCNCQSDKTGNNKAAKFQDEQYGKNVRIANPKLGNKQATCTVCGTVHSIQGA